MGLPSRTRRGLHEIQTCLAQAAWAKATLRDTPLGREVAAGPRTASRETHDFKVLAVASRRKKKKSPPPTTKMVKAPATCKIRPIKA